MIWYHTSTEHANVEGPTLSRAPCLVGCLIFFLLCQSSYSDNNNPISVVAAARATGRLLVPWGKRGTATAWRRSFEKGRPSTWPRGGMATLATTPVPLPDVDEDDGQGDGVVLLAQSLINIQSLSGMEQSMAASLTSWLTKRGWEVRLQKVTKASPSGVRDNMITLYLLASSCMGWDVVSICAARSP